MKTETIRFRATPEMKAAIEELTNAENKTMSNLIETAITQYLKGIHTMPATYREIVDRLNELGYTADQIETITAWWNWREHGEWLMTASKYELNAATLPAYDN